MVAVLSGNSVGQDTVVVVAGDPPVWGESLRLVEEVRVGALAGPEAYTFGLIGPKGVVVSADGTIWVADRHASVIRRFGRDGAHLGDVGGEGEGPGEFRRLLGIDDFPDGRVAAWDPALQRVTIFGANGVYLDQVRATGAIVPTRRGFQVDAAGRLWVLTLQNDGGAPGVSSSWAVYSTAGDVIASIPVPPRAFEGPRFARQSYGFAQMFCFARVILTSPSPHGYLVVGRNDEYVLNHPLEDGRVLRIERSWDPVAVKSGEHAACETLEQHFSARRGIRPGDVPTQKPPYWSIWVDDDGRLWVARHGEGVRLPETPSEREHRRLFVL